MRAQDAALLRSSVPMALDVGKSPSEASLSQDTQRYGSWEHMDRRTDSPELLGAEEAKPFLHGLESLAVSGDGGLASAVAQRSSSYWNETPSASGLPRVRASCWDRQPPTHGGEPCHRPGRRLFLEEQQMKTSAAHPQSPAEESSAADVPDIAPSPLESFPPHSPQSPAQSRSRSSFSALSLEENSVPGQRGGRPSCSSPGSLDVPAAASWELCRRPGAVRGGSPLPGDRAATGHRGVRKMSSYQADYWACAIPDSLPPSPDRRSPHWDPNKEYEELLDYAYPLKPRYKAGKMPEPFFHDSGVDLDSFSLSPEGTLRSTSVYGRGWQAQGGRENGHLGAGAPARRHSTPAAGKPGWAGAASPYKLSPIAKASFAKSPSSTGIAGPSRGFAKDLLAELSLFDGPSVDGRSWGTRGSPFPHHKGKAKGAERFLPTTRVLPLRREWDGDEEFLSLPPRLQELERLSQVLSDLSLTIRTPREGNGHIVPPSDSRGSLSSTWAPLGGAGSRGSAGPCHPRSWDGTGLCGDGDPLPRAQLPTSSGDGRHRSELSPAGHPRERGQQGESLAQCVKVFCRQLQELLRWLYDVADTTEGWKPPTPDAASVRAALHRYVEFRKDVADHRSLTESVLQHGAALLECMASNSPALKDTLGLIEKQSEELESHAERLYQSVLAALGPGQGEDGSSRQPAALHQAQWVLPLSLGCVGRARDG